MEHRLRKALEAAKADYAEIRVHEGGSTSITYTGKELEDIGERTGVGGCVRVLIGGGWGFTAFNDLDDLPRFVELACEQARMIQGEPIRLSPQDPHRTEVDLATGHDPSDVPLADKEAICRRYNDRLAEPERIQTTSVRYRDSQGTTHFANTDGTYLAQRVTFCGVSVSAIAKDGMDVQHAYESVGDLRGFDKVTGLDETCDTVARRAVELLDAKPVEGGKYTVVVDPKLSGVFVHEAFGHLSEADFIYENEKLREIMTIGRRFGPDDLCIVDEGCMKHEAGYMAFDSEGTPTRKTYLIRDGILASRLHSRETAAKMDEEPTGNARAISHSCEPIVRMTNTYMEPRDKSFDEIVASTPSGIYAIGALGGQTNTEMFTFSAEEAYEIKDGKVGGRVRDVVLTGNVFETLANIDMIGNDMEMYGGLGGCGKGGQSPLRVGDGGPHIRIQNVVIGGR